MQNTGNPGTASDISENLEPGKDDSTFTASLRLVDEAFGSLSDRLKNLSEKQSLATSVGSRFVDTNGKPIDLNSAAVNQLILRREVSDDGSHQWEIFADKNQALKSEAAVRVSFKYSKVGDTRSEVRKIYGKDSNSKPLVTVTTSENEKTGVTTFSIDTGGRQTQTVKLDRDGNPLSITLDLAEKAGPNGKGHSVSIRIDDGEMVGALVDGKEIPNKIKAYKFIAAAERTLNQIRKEFGLSNRNDNEKGGPGESASIKLDSKSKAKDGHKDGGKEIGLPPGMRMDGSSLLDREFIEQVIKLKLHENKNFLEQYEKLGGDTNLLRRLARLYEGDSGKQSPQEQAREAFFRDWYTGLKDPTVDNYRKLSSFARLARYHALRSKPDTAQERMKLLAAHYVEAPNKIQRQQVMRLLQAEKKEGNTLADFYLASLPLHGLSLRLLDGLPDDNRIRKPPLDDPFDRLLEIKRQMKIPLDKRGPRDVPELLVKHYFEATTRQGEKRHSSCLPRKWKVEIFPPLIH